MSNRVTTINAELAEPAETRGVRLLGGFIRLKPDTTFVLPVLFCAFCGFCVEGRTVRGKSHTLLGAMWTR
jgi:hypothetical protein